MAEKLRQGPVTGRADGGLECLFGWDVITVLSRFVVANGMESEVREAFVNRPHLVEKTPGFLRLEVLSPAEEPKEFWLLTYWETEQHFRDWHKQHRHESHQLMPKGLRLDATGTKVTVLNHVAS